VHGIWMTGLELQPLARRLRKAGFDTHLFRYPSLRRSPQENAAALLNQLRVLGCARLHFVAHSLGGLVLLHLFAAFGDDPALRRPGRVVLLGSPVRGSVVAQRLNRSALLRPFLGRSIEQGLLGDVPDWVGGRAGEWKIGVIAGNRGFGVGSLFGGLPQPADGTVSVAETRLPGAAHITLPHGHFGLLLAAETAELTTRFLRQGRF
jgi:pimeloyl-ACP methyl ester carboxylesterase